MLTALWSLSAGEVFFVKTSGSRRKNCGFSTRPQYMSHSWLHSCARRDRGDFTAQLYHWS
ncbi:hypothetical protein BKA80DRAFT_282315 [Phyllosticta citrichinensis]